MTSQHYSIKYRDIDRESFGHYEYEIFAGSTLIARYWHDYRGDDHGIEFLNGPKENSPVGRMTEFIVGGGLKPLGLSKAAQKYLSDNLSAIK